LKIAFPTFPKIPPKVFLPQYLKIRVAAAPGELYSVGAGRIFYLEGQCVSRWTFASQASAIIAKSKNPTSFAKRQREQEKKRKASEKLAKRAHRKAFGPPPRDAEDENASSG
jgi:hypothetical protein